MMAGPPLPPGVRADLAGRAMLPKGASRMTAGPPSPPGVRAGPAGRGIQYPSGSVRRRLPSRANAGARDLGGAGRRLAPGLTHPRGCGTQGGAVGIARARIPPLRCPGCPGAGLRGSAGGSSAAGRAATRGGGDILASAACLGPRLARASRQAKSRPLHLDSPPTAKARGGGGPIGAGRPHRRQLRGPRRPRWTLRIPSRGCAPGRRT